MSDNGYLGGGFASIATLMPASKTMMQGYQDMLDYSRNVGNSYITNEVTPLMALETDAGDRLLSAGDCAKQMQGVADIYLNE